MSQAKTTEVYMEVVASVNPILGTTPSGLREFMRMNLLEFYGSKVEEDPQYFIDKA